LWLCLPLLKVFHLPFPTHSYLFSQADFEDIVTNINSVSTSPIETGESWKHTSLQGGAYLWIKGSGFSTRSPLSNRVTVGDLDCPVIGNFLLYKKKYLPLSQ